MFSYTPRVEVWPHLVHVLDSGTPFDQKTGGIGSDKESGRGHHWGPKANAPNGYERDRDRNGRRSARRKLSTFSPLHRVRNPLGWWVGRNRHTSTDGCHGRASGWWECFVAASERVIHRFTRAWYVSEVAFVRSIESAAPEGPRETVVPSYLHGRVSSPHRE